MLTLSNFISLLRLPLAILFLINNVVFRAALVVGAMLTDVIDGYLARRWRITTKLGAALDPIMDKFFVIFVVCVLYHQGTLSLNNSLLMISRDFAIVIFGFFLLGKKQLKHYQYGAVLSGKITTSLQFIALFFLSLGYSIPSSAYYVFLLLAVFFLTELFYRVLRDSITTTTSDD
jgi:CDP-diacylglycerol---glycerol-3-phosphate 3-phosphatidyltransferase